MKWNEGVKEISVWSQDLSFHHMHGTTICFKCMFMLQLKTLTMSKVYGSIENLWNALWKGVY